MCFGSYICMSIITSTRYVPLLYIYSICYLLDVGSLSRLSKWYYRSGLSPSTRKAYQTGLHAYRLSVQTQTDGRSLSQRPHCFCLSSTIKIYLAAIRNAHVGQGEHKYFMEASTPRLQQVMKGIQREQATMKCQRVHKPITITIMPQIEWILSKVPLHHNLMVWAACCTAYFGFLRSSEFTVPYRRLLTSTLTSPLKTWQ